MAQDYASSISGVALRITRLTSDGSFATGPSASYVLNSDFISLSFTPEYEEGDEFVQKGADGTVCATYKAPDTLKRVTLEIAICNPDPEFTELISGGVLLSDGGTNVGYATTEVGVDGNPYGAAIEVWSKAIQNGKPASVRPYWHWIFPYTIMRPSGDRAIENGLLANTFEGWGVGNEMFAEGPDASWAFPEASNRAYAYARTATAPTALHGYQAVTP
jgi:hypothetical protein